MAKEKMEYEDGFYFYSLPSVSGKAKSLIVILHGNQNHPDGYLKWADKMRQENPDADVLLLRGPVALNAPEEKKLSYRAPDIDDLYSWYEIDKRPAKQVTLLLRHAFNKMTIVAQLNKFIDHQLSKRCLKDKNLAIVGYSMGGIVAMQVALGRHHECAAAVCHSGAVLPFTKIRKKPPTLLVVGDQDEIFHLPKNAAHPQTSLILKAFKKAGVGLDLHHERSLRTLKGNGVPVEEKVFPGQNHHITDESWQEVTQFISKKLKPKK